MAEAQIRIAVEGARQVSADLGTVSSSVNRVENTVSESSRGLVSDLRRVTSGFSGVGDSMRELGDENTRTEAGFGMLKGAVAALGVTLSIDFFKDFINDTIETTAALKNMAAASGITGAQLSALTEIGEISGTGADKIVESMNIITEGMKGADASSDGVAAALKTLE